ncbi:hypothetical protein SDC9_71536 [bioreactor metagenome]|uniref:Uncharacterized protein n=1 Tax=bioreactor metagenome TaxID=1076179 RepID=A0A644YA33_9ZZZZ
MGPGRFAADEPGERCALDRLTHELRKPHPIDVHVRDESPHLRKDLNESLLAQLQQAHPHRRA